MQIRQIGCADLGDPARVPIGIFCSRPQEPGEIPDVGGWSGHLEAGAGEPGQKIVTFGLEVVGSGEEHAGEPARGDVAAVGVRTGLVDVLVQEVETAREAEGLDLFEEVMDGDGGVFGRVFAEVFAVGVDEAGAVFGDAEHALGSVGTGVAQALAGALLEAAQKRLTYVSGSRDDVTRQEMDRAHDAELVGRVWKELHAGEENIDFATLRSRACADVDADVTTVLKSLWHAGFAQVAAVDVYGSGPGPCVVKALVPGMYGPYGSAAAPARPVT